MLSKSIFDARIRDQVILLRLRNKLTVTAMADNLDMTRSRYYHCEQGRADFHPYDLYKVEQFFDIQLKV